MYKYASWFAPFVSSDLVADAFELARLARNLDMQASPYDVSHLGLESIKVETPEGRRQFAAEQRHVLERAEPLRARLTDALHRLADELDNVS